MACYRPLEAWQHVSGGVSFGKEPKDSRPIKLPCGRCIGCRQTRQRSWALRILHEASLYDVNSFVTLTYDDDHFEVGLNYADFQKFMRALRYEVGPTRYFAVGEYGSESLRPHFHAVLFNRTFDRFASVGTDLFASCQLAKLWPQGISSFGSVTYQSAAYVAGYCLKKVVGRSEAADKLRGKAISRVHPVTGEIVEVVPEMAHMSLKPGIGYGWFQKYWKEVYLARDGCVLKGGKEVPAPRYYDRLLESIDGDLRESKDYSRYLRAESFSSDCTPARLVVRERCAIKRAFNKVRSL